MNNLEFPIFISGLAGVPGSAIFAYLSEKYPGQVWGIYPEGNKFVFGDGKIPCAAENTEKLKQIFDEYNFKTVIDASGNCALRACECDLPLSRLLNYNQAIDIAEEAVSRGTKFIRISVDLVFSGDENKIIENGYTENCIKDPVSRYGKDMADAEDKLLEMTPDVKIIRIPLPMEYSPNKHAGAIDWIGYRFKNISPATLYIDEVRSNIFGQDLAKVVEYMLMNFDDFDSEIWHCGGPLNLSLYQIGQIINVCGNFTPELLIGCPRIEAGPMPPRAGNVSMNSSKLLAKLPKGMIRRWPADDLLIPTDKDWHKNFDRGHLNYEDKIDSLLVQGDVI